jgi:hypothetical protein
MFHGAVETPLATVARGRNFGRMAPQRNLEAAQLQQRALSYSGGDPKSAIELLALAAHGLLRTPDMNISKDWSRRVLKDLAPVKHGEAK